MSRKIFLAAACIFFTAPATANTILALNTGYNNGAFAAYTIPASQPSNISDQYWIKIASYEPYVASISVSPAWVFNHAWGPWAVPLTASATTPATQSRWIGPRPVVASSPGASVSNPAYSIFRKCFCLMPGYQNPLLSFQIRGDDNIHVWLNTVTQTLVAPVIGNWGGGAPRSSAPTNLAMFRTGRNCIYVLLEDNYAGGQMGFDLAGTVSAVGLMPIAAQGVEASFHPCRCPSGEAGALSPDGSTQELGGGPVADAAALREVIRFAEARRLLAVARYFGGSAGGSGTAAAD
jgi:hypothetical protein